MELSKYVVKFDSDGKIYYFNTKNNISCSIDKKLIQKMQEDSDIYNQYCDFLKQFKFYPESDDVEGYIEQLKARDAENLSITILAHGDCNFRCKYCYEEFENMNISNNEDAILNFIANKVNEGQYKSLNIGWFGGEPLLGYKEIMELSVRMLNFAEERNIRYSANITTNGYLLSKDVFLNLVENAKVKLFQVTIDGDQRGHDSQRVLRNGAGSYLKILNNLKEISLTDSDFQIIVRMNVSKDNLESIKIFLDKDGLFMRKDPRYSLIFRNVGDWGQGERNSDYCVPLIENDISYDLSVEAITKGYRIADAAIYSNNFFSCYAQKHNSYGIDVHGNIIKCTVDLYNKKNIIGNILTNNNQMLNNEDYWIKSYAFSKKCINCNLFVTVQDPLTE